MSFILEALRRAEQDRRKEEAPALRALYEEGQRPRRRRPTWVWLALLLVANAVLWGIFFGPWSSSKTRPPAQTARAKTPGPKAASEKVLNKSARTPKPRQTGKALRPKEEAQKASAPKTPAPRQELEAVDVRRFEGPVSEPMPRAAAPPMEQAKTVSSPEVPKPPPAEAPLLAAAEPTPEAPTSSAPASPPASGERALPQPRTDYHEIPLIRDLPAEVREKLEGLVINVHAYFGDPAQRVVVINMKPYRKGERIEGDGPVVEEIIPNGVILNYGGGKARLLVRR